MTEKHFFSGRLNKPRVSTSQGNYEFFNLNQTPENDTFWKFSIFPTWDFEVDFEAVAEKVCAGKVIESQWKEISKAIGGNFYQIHYFHRQDEIPKEMFDYSGDKSHVAFCMRGPNVKSRAELACVQSLSISSEDECYDVITEEAHDYDTVRGVLCRRDGSDVDLKDVPDLLVDELDIPRELIVWWSYATHPRGFLTRSSYGSYYDFL